MSQIKLYQKNKPLTQPEWVDDALDYLDNTYGEKFYVSDVSESNGEQNIIYELTNGSTQMYGYKSMGYWNMGARDQAMRMEQWFGTKLKHLYINLLKYLYYDKNGFIQFDIESFSEAQLGYKYNHYYYEHYFFIEVIPNFCASLENMYVTINGNILSPEFYQKW